MTLYVNYDKEDRQTSFFLIGAGHFSTAILAQAWQDPKIRVGGIVGRDFDHMKDSMKKAAIPESEYQICMTREEAEEAFSQGKVLLLNNAEIAFSLPVDMIVEGTGNPEIGAKNALMAIESGKHVVMVNKETDSCVGPILNKLARDKGLIYAPVDGDQHGALIKLVKWARQIGLTVICAGKSRDAEYIYDKNNKTITIFEDGVTIPKTITVPILPDEEQYFETYQDPDLNEILPIRRKILNALDPRGGFDLCEMVIVANAVDLHPDIDTLHDYILRTPEIPCALTTREHNGLLDKEGTIEVVTTLREKGEAGMGGGEFLVVRCENAYSNYILYSKGCIANSTGSASLVSVPFHLCGVESINTVLSAGILNRQDIYEEGYRQKYDIVQEAACDLPAGTIAGSDHDTRFLTKMVPVSPISKRGAIPAHMLRGLALKQDVKAKTMITYDMVEEPKDSVLWKLRRMQDEM